MWACKRQEGCVLHFDAMGTVVRKIQDQKVVLYYCLIPKNENVPVFDFLSSEAITYILEVFNRDARKVNHGNSVQPCTSSARAASPPPGQAAQALPMADSTQRPKVDASQTPEGWFCINSLAYKRHHQCPIWNSVKWKERYRKS